MTTDIRLSDLKVGQELDDGGQGKIYALENQPNHVVKLYHDRGSPDMHPEVLADLVRQGPTLEVAGAGHTSWSAWPLARVSDGGIYPGFTMQLVPAPFWITVGTKTRLANLSFLAAKRSATWGNLAVPSNDEKLKILAHLASVMSTLHEHGLVIGDLSFGNVLWRVSPAPSILLLDCDGIHPEGGPSVMPQADTLDWDDKLAIAGSPPDRDRDNYKLALAVQRVLSVSLSARPEVEEIAPLPVAEHIDRGVRGLLRRAAGPPGSRPTAREWHGALTGRRTVPVTPPMLRQQSAPPAKPEVLARPQPGAQRATRPVTPRPGTRES